MSTLQRTCLKAGGGNPVEWLNSLERINVGWELCGHRFKMSHCEPLTQAQVVFVRVLMNGALGVPSTCWAAVAAGCSKGTRFPNKPKRRERLKPLKPLR